VYKNIRAGFDGNLRDYLDENVIEHAFYHNAFLVVSNGDNARYGSITSAWEHFGEWKRLEEKDKGSVDAEVLLNGMLAKDRLLDLVENFILFDASKPGTVRKVVARNHQVLGVNLAVAAAAKQEALKLQFPPELRLKHRLVELPNPDNTNTQVLPADLKTAEPPAKPYLKQKTLQIIERAHPDLGRLGVVWHTQGSGKSYSMAFFTEKVRRTVPGNFTFVLMTDHNDLDSQIYKTFVGCGIANDNTPRATSGKELEVLLKQNHCYVFSLIHKFNQDVNPAQPYSERDDIIVISDEAHRTQSGKLARNMRLVTTTSTRSFGPQLISGRASVLSWRILLGTSIPCRIMLVVQSKCGIGFFLCRKSAPATVFHHLPFLHPGCGYVHWSRIKSHPYRRPDP
jgi:type I restriction enzyme R subunit